MERKVADDVAADTLLIDFVRGAWLPERQALVARPQNCGLCTVFMDEKPVLSCSVLAARASGHTITTLEGLQGEAAEFGAFIADQGGGAVRLLQSRLYDERDRAVPRKAGPD